MPITRQASKLNTQAPANTSQITAQLNMQPSSSSSPASNNEDNEIKAPNPPNAPASLNDWFDANFIMRRNKLTTDICGYLTTQRAIFKNYFEIQLNLLKSSVWYKSTPRSVHACYDRAYQEALLEFANAVATNKIPFYMHISRMELAKQILNDVIATEMQLKNDSSDISDITHYATAILLQIENDNKVCLGDEKGKAIIGHLKDAVQPSQFPKALIQLGHLYSKGVDPEMKPELQIQESANYYLTAAKQDIASAQNHAGVFYLTNVLGRNLSSDQRFNEGIDWLEKSAANGNQSALQNMIRFKQTALAVEAYKTYNTI